MHLVGRVRCVYETDTGPQPPATSLAAAYLKALYLGA